MAMTALVAVLMALPAEPTTASAPDPGHEAPSASETADAPLSPRGLSGKVALGGSLQRIHTVPIISAELLLAFGGRIYRQSAYMTLDLQRGRTEFGLDSWGLHTGASSEWVFGRLRLGVGARAGLLFIERVSEDGSLWGVSLGVRGSVAFDFVRLGGGKVLYLEASPRADFYDPTVLCGGVNLGFRWDTQRRIPGPDNE